MKEKILYIAGLAVIVYLNIMYPWGAGRLFLAGLLVLPFLCEMSAWYLAFGTGVEVMCENHLLNEGEMIKLSAKVTGHRKLLPGKMKIVLDVPGAVRRVMTFSTESQKVQRMEIKAETPGIFEISVRKISVRDVFGIGSVSRRGKRTVTVTVMPEICPVSMKVSEHVWNFPLDSDEFSKTRSGDDVSEVFDVREYRPGDSMQRVHWKLSARQDRLWVKEYSFPLGAPVVLFAEGRDEKGAVTADFLRGFASFSRSLLEHGCTHYAAWEGRENHFPKRFLVLSEETFYEMLSAFLKDSADGFGETIVEQYQNEFPDRYCRGLVWDENSVLRRDEEVLFRLEKGEDLRNKLKEIQIEV